MASPNTRKGTLNVVRDTKPDVETNIDPVANIIAAFSECMQSIELMRPILNKYNLSGKIVDDIRGMVSIECACIIKETLSDPRFWNNKGTK